MYHSIISLTENSTIIISGTVKFLYNHVVTIIELYDNNIQYVIIIQNSSLEISHNKVQILFKTGLPGKNENEKPDFLITFYYNKYYTGKHHVFITVLVCLLPTVSG